MVVIMTIKHKSSSHRCSFVRTHKESILFHWKYSSRNRLKTSATNGSFSPFRQIKPTVLVTCGSVTRILAGCICPPSIKAIAGSKLTPIPAATRPRMYLFLPLQIQSSERNPLSSKPPSQSSAAYILH